MNDPWFQPEFVRRMAAAYRRGGGEADITMLPPVGTDGHTLYTWEANALIQPAINHFLRANNLPAMVDDQAFAPILAMLPPDDKRLLSYYLLMPTEKALAVPSVGHGTYFVYAQRSIEVARQRALERCHAFSRMVCELVAENMVLTGKWRDLHIRGDGQ